MYVPALNTTDAPIVIDDEGRTVAGRSWAPVLTTTEQAKAAFASGTLQKAHAGAKELDPEAAEAVRAAEELEAARKADEPEQVADLADDAGTTPTVKARRATARQE